MWFLLLALFGLLVPNGFFVYWLLFEFHGLSPIFQDKLALGFIPEERPAAATALPARSAAR